MSYLPSLLPLAATCVLLLHTLCVKRLYYETLVSTSNVSKVHCPDIEP